MEFNEAESMLHLAKTVKEITPDHPLATTVC